MAPKAAAEPQVVAALTSFVGLGGQVVLEGDLFASDDPTVTKWPTLFTPAAPRRTTDGPRIEQATAAPGEKRGA
jgi:hypothetical protein